MCLVVFFAESMCLVGFLMFFVLRQIIAKSRLPEAIS